MSNYFKAFSFLKKGIGGTKKSDEIKKAVGIRKKFEDLETKATKNLAEGKTMLSRSDLVEQAKNVRDTKRGKRDADKFVKETLKGPGFKKGGRIGFNKGTGRSGVPAMDIKNKISLAKKKKKNNKTPFGMLSVKAGIDKNPNPTQADRIAGAKMKNKKKVI